MSQRPLKLQRSAAEACAAGSEAHCTLAKICKTHTQVSAPLESGEERRQGVRTICKLLTQAAEGGPAPGRAGFPFSLQKGRRSSEASQVGV
jgi:hypothetical protein